MSSTSTSSTTALLESSTAELLSILIFIFGGCCSNVWALEAVLKTYPGSGTFLTFSQIVYVAFGNLAGNVEVPALRTSTKFGVGKEVQEGTNVMRREGARWTRWTGWIPRLKARKVPLWRWGVQVVLFLGVSLLNNRAFAYKIPLTLHIIFRSGGLCVSMLTGRLIGGKKYTIGQAVAGVIITAGIVLATLSAPSRRSSPPAATTHAALGGEGSAALAATDTADTAQFLSGIAMLCTALVLSALLGLWQERIYALYGTVWQEGLFYSHLLSLPFFAPMSGTIATTYKEYAATPPVTLLALPSFAALDGKTGRGSGGITLPSALAALVINVVTQGFCIRGVNRLTARVSSTTVNLVLTVRKAVSLALSVWYYGSGITPGLAIGGGMVLGGTIIYGLATPPRTPSPTPKAPHGSRASDSDTHPTDHAEPDNASSAKTTGISTHLPETAVRNRKKLESDS